MDSFASRAASGARPSPRLGSAVHRPSVSRGSALAENPLDPFPRRRAGVHALRKLALATGATTDELLFEADERGPDDELRLQSEAISRFDPDEKKTAKDVLNGPLLKHEARRRASSG